nr:uncharacterized protein LOC104118475 isoform X2 [Nicotiana tomentosiformis]XP_033508358.1 uncharacterized protein LOC104118475 isoform X2 [Nicotiana tomentosiformis]
MGFVKTEYDNSLFVRISNAGFTFILVYVDDIIVMGSNPITVNEEKIELELSQSTVDESEILPNDAVGKVLGKEHSGRVRCLGLGAVPGRDFRQTRHRYSDLNASSYNNGSCSSQWQEKYNQMLNAHNQIQENYREMMNAFKAYMIMKEGRIPEEFAGIFVSPPHSTVRKVHNFLI